MWVKKPYKEDAKITSPFGYRVHPISGANIFHKGIDISLTEGTEISAPITGYLTPHINQGGENVGFGKYCILEGATEQGLRVRFIFGHLSTTFNKGKVIAGNLIALSGNSGASTGPHLHLQLEILKKDKWIPVNPLASMDFANGISQEGVC